ncbi:MAG: LytTR family DNA-binding domain-containing protein [Bacteroidota bacterium]
MRCIIIEDQPPAQRLLKKYIKDIGTLSLQATFSDAISAMEYLRKDPVDLIFLDIHLPKISGIDFLKTVQNPPHVILTTAFTDYALESYEFSVVDYLLKPFSFHRFVKAVNKILPEEKSTDTESAFRKEIFIKSGYEHVKVTIADIIFIKSDADYTEIHLPLKKLLSSEPLRYWQEELDDKLFVRIHKSYIINAEQIVKVVGNQVYLENQFVTPIGRAYKDAFTARFLNTS